MKNEEQIARIEYFLKEVIIKELDKSLKANFKYMQFVIMGQAIEVLGGFLDNKPMKAKGQSAKRFSKGINYLLGGRYRLLNENYFLYDKLRNQMTHAFLPSQDLILFNDHQAIGNYRHLYYFNGRLVIVAEDFYKDICIACERLLVYLKEGKIKPKNIAIENEE